MKIEANTRHPAIDTALCSNDTLTLRKASTAGSPDDGASSDLNNTANDSVSANQAKTGLHHVKAHINVAVKLNLGCGANTPAGWVNVDYALGARLRQMPLLGSCIGWLNRRFGLFQLQWQPDIVLQDLTKPLQWQENSVDIIYSSHTLEHLDRHHGQRLMAECYRILKPGGILRIVVPDLRHFILQYQAGEFSADYFVERLGVLYLPSNNRIKTWLAPFYQYPHRCMYDADTLINSLSQQGFKAELKHGFDSAILDIHSIELADRVQHALVVEAVKY